MKNKVLKNVVLFACFLGMVLFPVSIIFATDYTFSSTSDFVSAFNAAISFTATDYTSTLFVNDIDNSYTTLFNHLISTYSIDTDNLVTVVTCENANYIYMRIYTADRMPYQGYVNNLTSGSPIISLSYPSNTNFTNTYGQVKKADGVFSNLSHQSFSGAAISCQNQNTNRASFAGFVPYHLTVSPTSQYLDYYTLNVSNNPGGGGNTPGSDDGFEYETYTNPLTPSNVTTYVEDSTPYTYYVYQSLINNPNYDPSDAWQHYRVMVGSFPMMWEYYFRWFSNMSLGYMDNISSSLQEMITLSNNIQDIADRLEMAFPDDQAELNDSIAETLLDDTNNTGLTAEKVSNAKSDFDEGVSMYQIDTSQSEYSTPFSAIQSGDWSFWSSTTLNNLGSGYQYTYTPQTRSSKKASNDDDDIYESNQKSLFDLLGW